MVEQESLIGPRKRPARQTWETLNNDREVQVKPYPGRAKDLGCHKECVWEQQGCPLRDMH